MLKDVKVPPYEQPPLSQTYSTASTSESGTHSSSITETQQNPFSYKSNDTGNIFDALNEGQVTLPLTSSSIFSNCSRWSKHTRCFKFGMWARQWILRAAALVHPSKNMEQSSSPCHRSKRSLPEFKNADVISVKRLFLVLKE